MNLLDLPVFLLATIAAWLGLSLLLRDPTDRVTRAFAWLSLHLTIYGITTALAPLSRAPEVSQILLQIQAVESVLLPPVFLHFIIRLVSGAFPPRERMALTLFYITGSLLGLYALFGPGMQQDQIIMRFPAGLLTWAWVLQRAIPLMLALILMFRAYRTLTGDDLTRRRHLLFAISAIVGVVGALIATVSSELRASPALGHALMAAALVVLAFAVLVYRSLIPERMAKRAVYRSMIGGVLTALYIAALVAIEPLARRWLAVDGPYITVLTLVIVIAIAAPLRDWVSSQLDRIFFHREFDFGHLLRAIGNDLLERGTLNDQLQTALSAICGTLDLESGLVAVRDGQGLQQQALYGMARINPLLLRDTQLPDDDLHVLEDWDAWPEAHLIFPLNQQGEQLGLLALGPKRSGEPYNHTERALLRSLASYVALAIRHARRQQEEQLALAVLAEQSKQLQAEQEALIVQAVAASRNVPAPAESPKTGLRVYALGPLRVERDGQPVERWGGDKAGTYQAEALFAFLFDRRGRGLTKDEAAEVIWPDLELEKSDMAFHRTLSGLRRTLEPGLRRGNESTMVSFHHERYWLNPAVIGWSDVEAYASAVEQGHTQLRQGNDEAARSLLSEAVNLYRGEYMDDCPFFGDSSYVEERRTELRDQQRDALLALAGIYERLERPGEAATCYRRALAAADGDCARAEDALARLVA